MAYLSCSGYYQSKFRSVLVKRQQKNIPAFKNVIFRAKSSELLQEIWNDCWKGNAIKLAFRIELDEVIPQTSVRLNTLCGRSGRY